MKQLSIIIPATGLQNRLDDTLVSVLENRPEDSEVLLVHPAAYVDPYDLADEVRLISSEQTDVLELLNVGFKHAHGSILHTLAPGVTAHSGWCEEVLAMFDANSNIGSVAPSLVDPRSRRTVHGVAHSVWGKKIVTSSKQHVVCPLLCAGFYRTSAMRFMQGFNVRFGQYAGVELGLRLKSANYKADKCDSRIHFSSETIDLSQVGFRDGQRRGELMATATRLGLSTKGMAWAALLLGEPIHARFGSSTLAAMLGHLSSWRTSRVAGPVSANSPASSDHENRRAA